MGADGAAPSLAQRLGLRRDPLRAVLLVLECALCLGYPASVWASTLSLVPEVPAWLQVASTLGGLGLIGALACLGWDVVTRRPPRTRGGRRALTTLVGAGLVGLAMVNAFVWIALPFFAPSYVHGLRRIVWLRGGTAALRDPESFRPRA